MNNVSLSVALWNTKVIGMAALVFTGDVESKLQRPQWRPGQSPWWLFHFWAMMHYAVYPKVYTRHTLVQWYVLPLYHRLALWYPLALWYILVLQYTSFYNTYFHYNVYWHYNSALYFLVPFQYAPTEHSTKCSTYNRLCIQQTPILHSHIGCMRCLLWVLQTKYEHNQNSYHLEVTKYAFNSSPPGAPYVFRWTGSALFQLMACRLDGAKPLSEPMLTNCQL